MTAGSNQPRPSPSSLPSAAVLGDFILILLAGALLAALLGLAGLSPAWLEGPLGWLVLALRIPLGLAFVLYIPGYLLQAAFFPARDDLDGVERLGLSLGLSLGLLVLLALLLDRLPWGLRPLTILLGQAALILLLIALAAWQRLRLPAAQAHLPRLRPQPARWWSGLQRAERRLLLALGAALLLALLAAAWIFLVPSSNQYMTEFYLLGPAGLAEDFPRQAAVGQPLQVTFGVVNRQRAAETYHLEVWVQDPQDQNRRRQVAALDPFTLQPGQLRQQSLAWQMPWAGPDQQVEFLLFQGAASAPYRHLRLILDVEP